ncbi:MAG: hypothetical protein K0S74_580 [Chlamydiales bacterium]|jgi:hypothetical protein|nr:hypothetical protein [Chlamydiales bacterium]
MNPLIPDFSKIINDDIDTEMMLLYELSKMELDSNEQPKITIASNSLTVKEALDRINSDIEKLKIQEALFNDFVNYNHLGEEKFLRSYSLLDNKLINLELFIEPNLFAAIHAQNIIEATDYEGGKLSHSLQLLVALMRQLKASDFINLSKNEFAHIQKTLIRHEIFISNIFEQLSSVTTGIEKSSISNETKKQEDQADYTISQYLFFEKNTEEYLLQFRNLVESIISSFEKLEIGQSTLLPGGFNSFRKASGHDILYEITKRENDFTFTIHNTGEGLNHHPHIRFMLREKSQTSLQYEGLQLEDFKEESFKRNLQALLEYEYAYQIFKNLGRDVTIFDIYRMINATFCLKPHVRITPAPLCDYKEAQRAGNCFWYVCKLPLQKLFSNPSNYKRFKYLIKIYSIVEFYKQNSLEILNNKSLRLLLREAAENLAKSTLKMWKYEYASPLLSSQEAAQAYATAKDLLHRLNCIEQATRNFTKPDFDSLENLLLTNHNYLKPILLDICKHCHQHNQVAEQPATHNYSRLVFKVISPHLEDINPYLTSVLGELEILDKENANPLYTISLIQEITKYLPSPSITNSIWFSISPDQAEPVANSVYYIAECYFKKCIQSLEKLHSTQFIILYKLLAILNTTAVNCKWAESITIKEIFPNYSFPLINFKPFEDYCDFPFSYTKDPLLDNELLNLKNYWQHQQKTADENETHTMKFLLDESGNSFFDIANKNHQFLSSEKLESLTKLVDEEFKTCQYIKSTVSKDQLTDFFITADIGQFGILPSIIANLKKLQLMIQTWIVNGIDEDRDERGTKIEIEIDCSGVDEETPTRNSEFGIKFGFRDPNFPESDLEIVTFLGEETEGCHNSLDSFVDYDMHNDNPILDDLTISDVLFNEFGTNNQIIHNNYQNITKRLFKYCESADIGSLKIVETLLLYQSNPDYFKDKQKQILFDSLFFNPNNNLMLELFSSLELAKRLIESFSSLISHFHKDQKEIELIPLIYIIDTSCFINSYIEYLGVINPSYNITLIDLDYVLNDILSSSIKELRGLNAQENQSLIRSHRLFKNLKKSFPSLKDIQEIIEDHALLQFHPAIKENDTILSAV